jgi:RNA polymerase primary sigma factor
MDKGGSVRDELDGDLLERVMRRLALYVRNGQLDDAVVRRTAAATGLQPPQVSRLRRELTARGVRVVDMHEDAASRHEPESEAQQPDAAQRRDEPETPKFDRRLAIRAAKDVLALDRRMRHPERRLLTPLEEHGLALLLSEGRGDGPLPKGELGRLPTNGLQYQAGEALVLHNLRLARSIAGRHEGQGLERADLDQHGIVGLMRAVERFDPARGLRFSTYATWWIRQSIGRALADEGRTVRLPVHVHQLVVKVQAARERLLQETGRVSVHDLAFRTRLSPGQVGTCLRLARGIMSLDQPVPGSADWSLLDALADYGLDEQSHVVDVLAVDELLKHLSERDATILRLRFGLDDGNERTLEDVGRIFGLTRERIRQLQERSLERLADLWWRDVGEPAGRQRATRTRPGGSCEKDSTAGDGDRASFDENECRRATRGLPAAPVKHQLDVDWIAGQPRGHKLAKKLRPVNRGPYG